MAFCCTKVKNGLNPRKFNLFMFQENTFGVLDLTKQNMFLMQNNAKKQKNPQE